MTDHGSQHFKINWTTISTTRQIASPSALWGVLNRSLFTRSCYPTEQYPRPRLRFASHCCCPDPHCASFQLYSNETTVLICPSISRDKCFSPGHGLYSHPMWNISASKKDSSCSSLSGSSLSTSAYACCSCTTGAKGSSPRSSSASASVSSTLTLRAFLVFFAFGVEASSALVERWLVRSSSSSSAF